MPFIARKDVSIAYDAFIKKGMPNIGKDFETALVKILFKELAGAERLSLLFLDSREYQSYKHFAARGRN
jgi:hypothetical protein